MSVTLAQLQDVFVDVFDADEIEIKRETTAKDVDGWDSLMHVTLIVSVEQAFNVKFSSREIVGLENVGQLLDLIETKVGAKRIA